MKGGEERIRRERLGDRNLRVRPFSRSLDGTSIQVRYGVTTKMAETGDVVTRGQLLFDFQSLPSSDPSSLPN